MSRKIKCLFGSHELFKVRKLLDNSMLIGCRSCGGYWGTMRSYYGRGWVILKFSEDMHEMYTAMKMRIPKKYISNKRWSLFWRG